jgi:hypothetical protein
VTQRASQSNRVLTKSMREQFVLGTDAGMS